MDGLGCGEVYFSHVTEDNETLRLDAEFFAPKYIRTEEMLKGKHCFYLDADNIVSGPFGSTLRSSAYLERGDIPFVRIQNIIGGFKISMSDIVYISKQDNDRIKNSEMHLNDLILSKVGNSIGYFARVDDRVNCCNISENNIGIKLGTFETAKKHYILTFLNCKYARELVLRRRSGNGQPKLNVGDISHIPIPRFSNPFYKSISEVIEFYDARMEMIKEIYRSAELELERAIGLDRYKVSEDSCTRKSFMASFAATGRLDAEYYQPKYECYEQLLRTNETVGSACKLYDNNFVPNPNNSYRYIEIANIGLAGEISAVDTLAGGELPTRARRQVRAGQVIISSIEGSLPSCALVTEEYDGCLCSTGFYVVDSEKMNAETLLILFKSRPIQELMRQRCSGTILTNISKEVFLSMPLPVIRDEIQKRIAYKVQEVVALRRKSEQMLDCAVRAVEMAIEHDEKTAQRWLSTVVTMERAAESI